MTEAQLKRIKEVRWAIRGMPGHETKITKEDVALLIARVDDLNNEECSCAEEIIEWARDRLEEDLRSKRAWLEDAVENARVAELMVREAEHALAAVQALKDGGMHVAGDEINSRWDAIRDLYAAQGMLPAPEAAPEPVVVAPEPEQPAEPPPPAEPPVDTPEPDAQPESIPVEPVPALVARKKPRFDGHSTDPDDQERRMYAALQLAAAGASQIQERLSVLAETSGVPKGSALPVLRRLADAKRIEIIKAPLNGKVPAPNIYRFIEGAAQEQVPDPPQLSPPETPVPAQEAATKLAAAWGGRVKPAKPSGSVSQTAPLRERIVGALKRGACTTSGLASMLDVKELGISQTLAAMEHEGSVTPDAMPEGGRRAQLWRVAESPEA